MYADVRTILCSVVTRSILFFEILEWARSKKNIVPLKHNALQ